jgi:hypothetical protein
VKEKRKEGTKWEGVKERMEVKGRKEGKDGTIKERKESKRK